MEFIRLYFKNLYIYKNSRAQLYNLINRFATMQVFLDSSQKLMLIINWPLPINMKRNILIVKFPFNWCWERKKQRKITFLSFRFYKN
jgi:hypothetical protein